MAPTTKPRLRQEGNGSLAVQWANEGYEHFGSGVEEGYRPDSSSEHLYNTHDVNDNKIYITSIIGM